MNWNEKKNIGSEEKMTTKEERRNTKKTHTHTITQSVIAV